MNAAKALLASKAIVFDPYHGVTASNIRGNSRKFTVANEGVKFKTTGVLPSLSATSGSPMQRAQLR